LPTSLRAPRGFQWKAPPRGALAAAPGRSFLPSFLPRAASQASSEAPKYTLCYFDIRGVAETSRMLFALSKTPFEDKRFTITFGTPGDFKTIQRPEFDAAKASGDLDVSLGKVPYLEVNGQKFGQSKAIERYLAKQFGLYGGSDIEAAIIDQLGEHVTDFRTAYNRVRGFGPVEGEEKKAALEKWFSEDLPNNMKLVEKSLPQCEAGPYLVGGKVSLADVILYQFCAAPGGAFDNSFTSNADAAKASFQECPRIKQAMEAVADIPEMQVYIAERPERPF
jgi:glutathione S-transferase